MERTRNHPEGMKGSENGGWMEETRREGGEGRAGMMEGSEQHCSGWGSGAVVE